MKILNDTVSKINRRFGKISNVRVNLVVWGAGFKRGGVMRRSSSIPPPGRIILFFLSKLRFLGVQIKLILNLAANFCTQTFHFVQGRPDKFVTGA